MHQRQQLQKEGAPNQDKPDMQRNRGNVMEGLCVEPGKPDVEDQQWHDMKGRIGPSERLAGVNSIILVETVMRRYELVGQLQVILPRFLHSPWRPAASDSFMVLSSTWIQGSMFHVLYTSIHTRILAYDC